MNKNIIDLRPFLALPAEEIPDTASPTIPDRVLSIVTQCAESLASITIALCIGVCTLVFFTML